jgi:hypothetical protein
VRDAFPDVRRAIVHGIRSYSWPDTVLSRFLGITLTNGTTHKPSYSPATPPMKPSSRTRSTVIRRSRQDSGHQRIMHRQEPDPATQSAAIGTQCLNCTALAGAMTPSG